MVAANLRLVGRKLNKLLQRFSPSKGLPTLRSLAGEAYQEKLFEPGLLKREIAWRTRSALSPPQSQCTGANQPIASRMVCFNKLSMKTKSTAIRNLFGLK